MPRNSSGAYSLPAGNPVISNTLIETNWANPTMADIGQALTESLDRYGRGGMLAPFRLFDGTVTAPALSFASETSTGIYRTTAGTWNLSILGVNVFGATATGVTIVPPTTFQGTATFNSPALRAVDPATGNELTRKTYVDNAISAATGGGLTYVKRAGDTMTGALILTVGAINGFRNYSGSLTIGQSYTLGRTTNEAYFGIAGQASNFTTGDVAGDVTLRSEQRIWLSIGAAGMMRMDLGAGILARYGFQAVGDLAAPVANGVRLGISAGSPIVSFARLDGAADSKYWDNYISPTSQVFRVINDAQSTAQVWLEVVRSGMTITTMTMPQGRLGVGGGAPAGTAIMGAGGQIWAQHDNGFRVTNSANTIGGNLVANAGWGTRLSSDTGRVSLVTSAVDRVIVLPGGETGIGRVPTQHLLEVQATVAAGYANAEGLRIVHDQAYIAFFNTANNIRSGYIQNNVGGPMLINLETSTNLSVNVPGLAGALVVNSGGVFNGTAIAGNRLVKVSEFGASTSTAAIPGLLFRFGRAATTVGATGTISFSSAMGAVYSIVATLEGGVGGGWVLRTYNHTVSGFQFAFDSYNSAGGGAACVITYWAVGS